MTKITPQDVNELIESELPWAAEMGLLVERIGARRPEE